MYRIAFEKDSLRDCIDRQTTFQSSIDEMKTRILELEAEKESFNEEDH